VNFESIAYAQQATGTSTGTGPSQLMVMLPMYLIIFAVFYFLLIKPQQKQQQAKLQMIAQLKKNDEVITSGGIYGTVVNVKDKSVVLKVDEGVKIELDKSSISTVSKSRKS